MKNIFKFIIYSSAVLTICFGSFMKAQAFESSANIVVDATGYEHKIKDKPDRIISLNTSCDEILLNLVDDSRIVAICTNSTDPNMSFVVERASKFLTRLPLRTNCEIILGLQPDLVLFPAGGPREMVDSLRDLGVNVFVVRASNNIQSIKEKIKEISIVVGEEQKGKIILQEMNQRLYEAKQFIDNNKLSPKVVLGFTFAGAYGNVNGLFHDICVHAGVINGAAEMGLKMGERLSAEQVIKVNPDIVLLPTWSHHKNNNPHKFKDDFINNEPYKNLKAVRTNNVYLLDEKYRGCGSHYVVDGIIKLHKIAYFNDKLE